MLHELVLVVEIDSVIKLGKLQDDLHDLWLVSTGQAVVLLPAENSLDALVLELWGNGIHSVVQSLVEWVLLGHQEHSFVLRLADT
jgi:hypothetical protein